jgi:hypothetical protein
MKFHLQRVVGNAILTCEEFYTVLCQTEAVLNSQLVTTLTDGPEDIAVLTRHHFLVGTSLVAVPDRNLADVKSSRLSRREHVQQLSQHLCKASSTDYLHQPQQIHKWKKAQPN